MTIKQSVRRTAKQGNLIPAVVRAVRGDKATVQLSTSGAIMRMLGVVGGPVEIGQNVHVDFTTSPPLVVAPSKPAAQQLGIIEEGGFKKRAPFTYPGDNSTGGDRHYDDMIEVYAGPPPAVGKPHGMAKAVYNPDAEGFQAALDIVIDGDVIYVPQCTISSVNFEVPNLPTLQSTPAVQNLYVIGRARADTVFSNCYWITSNNVTVRDMTFSYSANMSSDAVNTIVYGRSTFYNCNFVVANSGIGRAANAWIMFSSKARFINCTMTSDDLGILCGSLGNSAYLWADYQGNMEYAHYHGVPPGTPAYFTELTSGSRVGTMWQGYTPEGDEYYYSGLYWTISFPPGRKRPAEYKVKLTCEIATTDPAGEVFTSGSWGHIVEDNTRMSGYLGYEFEPDWDWMSPDDNGAPLFKNGWALSEGETYTDGDMITFQWSNTTAGSNNNWAFCTTLYQDAAHEPNTAYNHYLIFHQIYILYPDGSKEWLYPQKPYAYLEDCTLTSTLCDLYAAGRSIIEVSDCSYDPDKTFGYIIVWVNGHPSAVVGDLEPLTTYPGQMWFQP